MVSIIIPVYNAARFIDTCIESVLKQTYDKFELLIIDDGSNDGSGKICDKYAIKDRRVKVFHKINEGVSAARNYGLNIAEGKYVLFVDADDTIVPDTLEANVALAERTGADMVIFSFCYWRPDEERRLPNPLSMNFEGSKEDLFNKYFIELIDKEILNPPWNKLFRKELAKTCQIQFCEEYSICEDMAFSVEMLTASQKTVLNKEIYYNYILKATGTLVFKFYENYYEALSYFYQKAVAYCSKFQDSERQRKRVDTLYVNRTIMFIKRICCDSDWRWEQKFEKLSFICKDPQFIKSLQNAELTVKKSIIKILILGRRYRTIHTLYRLGKRFG